MGHRLDREAERNYREACKLGLKDTDITHYIDDHMEMANVLKTTLNQFDGGYVISGITGSGETFTMRDPWGIRPVFYYRNDEIVVIASERPVLQTTFDLECDDICELQPGEAIIVNKHGQCKVQRILPQKGDAALLVRAHILQPWLRQRHISRAQKAGRATRRPHSEGREL